MNQLEVGLRSIATALDRAGVQWALVGGFAVSARVEPRFTRDIDLAVAVEDDNAAESLVRELMIDGYELFASVEQEAVGRLATVRSWTAGAKAGNPWSTFSSPVRESNRRSRGTRSRWRSCPASSFRWPASAI